MNRAVYDVVHPRLGQYLGLPVIENRNLPSRAKILVADPFTGARSLHVNDLWWDITWPLKLAEFRRELQRRMARDFRVMEQRLGLPVTDRPGFVA